MYKHNIYPATTCRANTCVTIPIPLVCPSLNNNLMPSVTYSGWRANLNITDAESLVCMPHLSHSMIATIAAVCRIFPICTVVWNPLCMDVA